MKNSFIRLFVCSFIRSTVAFVALFAVADIHGKPGFTSRCVDPCGNTPILADANSSSALSGNLDAVAARGSVATLSLVVKSEVDSIDSFKVSCAGLTCGEHTIAPDAIDILLVKRWYQDGNAWFTEARDPAGRILVPELLLHDDTLVTVDDKTLANAVRSGGRTVSVAEVTTADRDVPALRPFALRAGEARQLLVRIAVAPGTPPGIYSGNLSFSVDGGAKPITLRVLDYDLPPPTARFTAAPYLFVSGQDWPGATKGAAPFTHIDSRKLADEAYVVGKAEDPKLAAAKKYHVFRSPATQRQLQARRSIGAIALDATPPLAGIENPAPWRRNKGVKAWLAGYGGVLVPAFAEAKSPWDENHGETRSRTLLYPVEGGAIPTLASVALEEACQDVRYLSLLNRDARRLLNAPDSRLVVEGRRVLAWFADIDAGISAPDTIRLDAIAWLERLHALSEGGIR